MEKHLLKEEDYFPRITTEIRHGFLLVWMGHIGREIISGRAGEPDFHFDEEEAKEILANFDKQSIDVMLAGYPVESKAIPDKYLRIAEGKMIKKSQIKEIIKIILKEAEDGGMVGGYRMTPAQQKTVSLLMKRSFTFKSAYRAPGGGVGIVLERPYGRGRHGGPRFADVRIDGTIGNDRLDVNRYLSVVGEMIVNKDEKPGADAFGFVNVEEITDADKLLEEAKKLAKKIWGDDVKLVSPFPAKSTTEYFKVTLEPNKGVEWLALTQTSGWLYSKDNKMVSVNDLSVNEKTNPDGTYTDDMESGIKAKAYAGIKEGIHDPRPCPCGSGEMSRWEFDGRGIPLCRTCSKCREEKLKRYRPEILRPYDQSDVDEPIEPDGDDLWESSSGHKYWMSYTEHNMAGSRRSNDIIALLRHAKNVGADQFGIYRQQPGFHSTTQQEFLVAWYDKSGAGYWSNMAKKNPELLKIQIKSLSAVPEPKLKEQTSSGAVFSGGPTIQTPAWGTRNKQGSPRAIKAAKKYGKVVKSISEKVT